MKKYVLKKQEIYIIKEFGNMGVTVYSYDLIQFVHWSV